MQQATRVRRHGLLLAATLLAGCQEQAPTTATAAGSAEVATEAVRPLAEQAAADAARH